MGKHEKNLRELRCVITHNPNVTLHHCHGGSMKDHGWHVGMGQKQNPFLQIPLKLDFHIGNIGIDGGYGVKSWEKHFGTQWEHLQEINEKLPYDIFEEAVRWEEDNRTKSLLNTGIRKSNGRE